MPQAKPDSTSAATEQAKAGRKPAQVRAMRGKVLVVDDVALLCEGIIRLLRHAHIAGDMARDAVQAMQLAEMQHYDLVVTDVMMPGMSGADLVDELGKSHPDLKVIVITGYATPKLISKLATARNVVDILSKPVDTHRLIARISSLIDAQHPENETPPSTDGRQ
jgi:DNA-binding NtrC family response regulator